MVGLKTDRVITFIISTTSVGLVPVTLGHITNQLFLHIQVVNPDLCIHVNIFSPNGEVNGLIAYNLVRFLGDEQNEAHGFVLWWLRQST